MITATTTTILLSWAFRDQARPFPALALQHSVLKVLPVLEKLNFKKNIIFLLGNLRVTHAFLQTGSSYDPHGLYESRILCILYFNIITSEDGRRSSSLYIALVRLHRLGIQGDDFNSK